MSYTSSNKNIGLKISLFFVFLLITLFISGCITQKIVPLKIEKQHLDTLTASKVPRDYNISVVGRHVIVEEHLFCISKGHDIEISAKYNGSKEIVVFEEEVEGDYISSIIDCFKIRETIGPLPKGEYIVKVKTRKYYSGKLSGEPPKWVTRIEINKTIHL